MGQELYRTGPKAAPRVLLNSIRIDLPMSDDDRLEEWASKERRSKREHVAYLVQEVLHAYSTDPLVLHRLKLGTVGAAR